MARKKKAEDKEPKAKKEEKYIAVGKIKEDGKVFLPGDEYDGKNVQEFIKSGYVEKA